MNNLTTQQIPLTYEAMMAFIYESNRFLTEKQAETDRLLKESSVKFEKDLKESSAKFEKDLKESSAKFEKEMEKSRAEQEKRWKKIDETMGSWGNNFGSFAEEYFINSFENNKQNFFGEKFNKLKDRVKGIKDGAEDEYDIMLINGRSVGIVEVKFKAHLNDVAKVLRKAQTLRINFPEFQKHKVYLGLATMAFYDELEQECKEQGIAIIKQVGDTVVIVDEHLKAF